MEEEEEDKGNNYDFFLRGGETYANQIFLPTFGA